MKIHTDVTNTYSEMTNSVMAKKEASRLIQWWQKKKQADFLRDSLGCNPKAHFQAETKARRQVWGQDQEET